MERRSDQGPSSTGLRPPSVQASLGRPALLEALRSGSVSFDVPSLLRGIYYFRIHDHTEQVSDALAVGVCEGGCAWVLPFSAPGEGEGWLVGVVNQQDWV